MGSGGGYTAISQRFHAVKISQVDVWRVGHALSCWRRRRAQLSTVVFWNKRRAGGLDAGALCQDRESSHSPSAPARPLPVQAQQPTAHSFSCVHAKRARETPRVAHDSRVHVVCMYYLRSNGYLVEGLSKFEKRLLQYHGRLFLRGTGDSGRLLYLKKYPGTRLSAAAFLAAKRAGQQHVNL